jgi:hypothetical protein
VAFLALTLGVEHPEWLFLQDMVAHGVAMKLHTTEKHLLNQIVHYLLCLEAHQEVKLIAQTLFL